MKDLKHLFMPADQTLMILQRLVSIIDTHVGRLRNSSQDNSNLAVV